MTIIDCITAFIAAKIAGNRRPTTIYHYRARLGTFAAWLDAQGITEIDSLTPGSIRDYLSSRLHAGTQASTVSQERAIILSCLRWLVREGYVDEQKWEDRVDRVRVDTKEPRYLTADECKRLITTVDTRHRRYELTAKRDAAIVRMLLDTGMRLGELLRLRIEDVDMVGRAVYVSAAAKGRRDRTVWFGSDTLRALRGYMRVRSASVGIDSLWVSRVGSRLSDKELWYVVRRLAHEAGLSDVSVHTLRHTAATLLLRNGMDVTRVQRILGYVNITMTMRYTHLMPDDLRAAHEHAAPVDRLYR